MRRLAVFSAADGEAVLTVDWRDVMPGINVTQALVLPDGIVVAGDNGSVSLLTHELKVLWTKFPKGAKNNSDAHIELLGSPGGNMVAVATYFIPAAPVSPLHVSMEVQLTVFDENGNGLVTHGGFKRLINRITFGLCTGNHGRVLGQLPDRFPSPLLQTYLLPPSVPGLVRQISSRTCSLSRQDPGCSGLCK